MKTERERVDGVNPHRGQVNIRNSTKPIRIWVWFFLFLIDVANGYHTPFSSEPPCLLCQRSTGDYHGIGQGQKTWAQRIGGSRENSTDKPYPKRVEQLLNIPEPDSLPICTQAPRIAKPSREINKDKAADCRERLQAPLQIPIKTTRR